jgi:hypothetical protein
MKSMWTCEHECICENAIWNEKENLAHFPILLKIWMLKMDASVKNQTECAEMEIG